MAFRAENVESAQPDYLFMLVFNNSLCAGKRLLPLLLSRFIGIDLLSLEKLASHEIRVATQKNVSAPASHIGGDSYSPFAARLGNDLRFAFMVLRVQNVVWNCFLQKTPGNQLRVFH